MLPTGFVLLVRKIFMIRLLVFLVLEITVMSSGINNSLLDMMDDVVYTILGELEKHIQKA